jgi:hypothetical protein
VRRRGISPRIVTADVVGTRGRTRVSGSTLRARFGLFDTWAYFTSIGMHTTPAAATTAEPRARAILAGIVYPERAGAEAQIQVRGGDGWQTVTTATVQAGGRYSAAVGRAGVYRAVFAGDAGPIVRVP